MLPYRLGSNRPPDHKNRQADFVTMRTLTALTAPDR